MCIRHQDDQYAHEVFSKPPYDGILVSKSIVDGTSEGSGRYTLAQRHRFYRVGVREFFRLGDSKLKTMGDCGAFSYIREPVPPVTPRRFLLSTTNAGSLRGFRGSYHRGFSA